MTAQQISDEYIRVARTNHYQVTVDATPLSLEDLQAAEQILISADNDANNADPVLNLALDLIEYDIAAKLRAA